MTDISGERKKLAEQGLQIIRREVWGARQSYTSARDCDVPADAFFLHISVTNLRADEHAGMREIESIGQSRFPGVGISYNAASFPSGRLYEGQPLTRRGAHTVNNFERATCPEHGGSLRAPSWNNNVNARALVLPQNVGDAVTHQQMDTAARWAAAQIRSGLARTTARWHGHRCVTAKDCPGGRGYAWIPNLQKLTDHYTSAGLRPTTATDEEEIMALSDETKAELRELVRVSTIAALETNRPIFGYMDGLYDDADNQMTTRDVVMHAAAQARAAVVTLAQLKTEVEQIKAQLAELRAALDPEGEPT